MGNRARQLQHAETTWVKLATVKVYVRQHPESQLFPEES